MDVSAPIYRLKRLARKLARTRKIPLNRALDETAQQEGYRTWGHLSRAANKTSPAARLWRHLERGDMMILGSRPGHGKTSLALDLLEHANKHGCATWFFTLAESAEGTRDIFANSHHGRGQSSSPFKIDTSDNICTDHIISELGERPSDAVVAIDYLQALDQRRTTASLAQQISTLKDYCRRLGIRAVVISQVTRDFDASSEPMPSLKDIRLPNPLDLSNFSKACFIHEGQITLAKVA
ncbi:MAG: DNA helicase [Pseudomonadota bacterium]